jgi:pyrroloquinoline quinone biosynthesis protein D
MTLEPDLYPRLSRGARLHFNRRTQRYVLLSPERVVQLDASAAAVLERCTGRHTVPQIVRDLLVAKAEPAAAQMEMAGDVLSLLLELEQRRLVEFGPARLSAEAAQGSPSQLNA